MIIYKSTKKGFLTDVLEGRIADEIDSAFYEHLGRHTSPNEVTSWKNSMMYMNNVINTKNIPDAAGIAIEYQIPLTSKRVDFILSGLNSEKKETLLIVELKQWEHAESTGKPGIVITSYQHGKAETAHPSYQAWSYAFMLKNYNLTIQERGVELIPCAYLHNYEQDGVIDSDQYYEWTRQAPIFLKKDALKLRAFIEKHIRHSSHNDIIWTIDNGRLKPSKQLADALVSMLNGNETFVMIDEQKVVFERAMSLAKASMEGNKHVLIVEGGPGTGKSVIAVNLLVKITQRGYTAQYVTKNATPREVYSKKLSGHFRNTYISSLFVGSGSFCDVNKNMLDCLIVDEAHRLKYRSGLFENLGENQIKEIINASKFSIFFVDDKQKIHIKDIGSVKSITKYAEECGAIVHYDKLTSQFRCNGSDGYLSWLDNALQIRETANIHLMSDDYDFRIFDNPSELFDMIRQKNLTNNKSRVVAGYCWNWVSKKNSNLYDIVFSEFNFRHKWNFANETQPWIIGDNSIEQIGCIHTCQGLELDYVGVIVGPDICYKDGKIMTNGLKRASSDQSLKGFKTLFKKDRTAASQLADEIIKNTYRTLMTRGMKGCYVYFCDAPLAKYFRQLLKEPELHVVKTPKVRIEDEINDDVKYIDFLPLYSIRAACGYFGNGEIVDEVGWIRVEGLGKLNHNMFVVQASGHSMEPKINDGDYCVFQANPAGSRQGKIVLCQYYDLYDPDYSGAYTIKKYESVKSYDEFGNWAHEKIMLNPLNKDYNPIAIDSENIDNFRIVAEYIGIIYPE